MLYAALIVVLIAAACIQSAEQDSIHPSATPLLPLLQPSPTATSLAQPSPTATINPNRPPGPGITSSAVTPGGSLWYALDQFDDVGGSPPYSQNYGLYRLQDGQVSHYDIPGTIRVLKVAPDGSLYVGAGWGVLRHHSGNWETLLNLECCQRDLLETLAPLDIAFTDGGDVWVGGAHNLGRFDGERWTEYDMGASLKL